MKRQLVKAEFLWSRKCPLSCSYCNMQDGRSNDYPLDKWIEGVHQLKELGCGFIAFYGAEPLVEFAKLPTVIQCAESLGIHTTVITTCQVPNVIEKFRTLIDHGLRSLSMSYDIIPLDKSSERKMKNTLAYLDLFRNMCPDLRDVAAIATLSRVNFEALPRMVRDMSARGIWTFFDFIHPSRGITSSKCRDTPQTANLLFRKEEYPKLLKVLEEVQELKESGHLVHSSRPFIEGMKLRLELNGELYDWNCSESEVFPSWVTVDCDGVVRPCDDFYWTGAMYNESVDKIHLHELVKKFDQFSRHQRVFIASYCPGCCWNTHIDAHCIKHGTLPFSDYVHKED